MGREATPFYKPACGRNQFSLKSDNILSQQVKVPGDFLQKGKIPKLIRTPVKKLLCRFLFQIPS
jgi:hypothetical protein